MDPRPKTGCTEGEHWKPIMGERGWSFMMSYVMIEMVDCNDKGDKWTQMDKRKQNDRQTIKERGLFNQEKTTCGRS